MILNYYVTELIWLTCMLKQLFNRAKDSGLFWIGQPTESHRRLFSDAKIRLSTMPNSYETICALEQLRLSGESFPVVLIDADVAQRDRDCFTRVIRQIDQFKELFVILFGTNNRPQNSQLYQQVIASNSALLADNDVLLSDKTVEQVKSIPEGVSASGKVLLLENNSTRRLIAQGLLRSLNVDHVIMDDVPVHLDITPFGVVLISYEMLDLPGANDMLNAFPRCVIMGGDAHDAFESISVPLREKELVKLLRGALAPSHENVEKENINLPTDLKPFQFDVAEVRDRLGVSEDIVTLVISTYQSDLDKQLQQLSDAISSGLPSDIKSAAHLIKGAASTVGAHELSQFAALLEKQAFNEMSENKVSDEVTGAAEQLLESLKVIQRDLSVSEGGAGHG